MYQSMIQNNQIFQMGRRKKIKIEEDIFEDIISKQACRRVENLNLAISSPIGIKTRQIEQISTATTLKKTRRIYKIKAKVQEDQDAEMINERNQVKVKLEVNDLKLEDESSDEDQQYMDDQKLPTVEVSDDIRAYYELVDISQTLDALIIKYYDDPLLSTIRMDTNSVSNEVHFRKKKYKTSQQNNILEQQFSNLKVQQNYDMENNESDQIVVKVQQQIQSPVRCNQMRNEQNQREQSVKVQFQSLEISQQKRKLGILSKHYQSNNKDQNQIKQFDKKYSHWFRKFQLQIESNLKENFKQYQQLLNQKEQSNIFSPKLSDLHRWISELAVFIDKFSAQQFEKLNKLKLILDSTLKSVNKAVKYHLDEMNLQIRDKNEGAQNEQEIGKCSKKNENEQSEQMKNEEKIKKKTQNDDIDDDHHVCRVCWQFFTNGHQLGGHMSKKHPGQSMEYRNKQLIKTRKFIERQRRLYFKMIQSSFKSLTSSKHRKSPKGRKQKKC